MNKREHPRPEAAWCGQQQLRRRLMLFWALLTMAAFGAVILVLSVTGLFSNADRQVQRGMDGQLESTAENLQDYLDQLTAQSLRLAQSAGQEIEALLMRDGIPFEALNDDPERLLELQKNLYGPVQGVLQLAGCSGAYAMLDATANTAISGAEHSRSGLYLRCINMTGSSLVDPDISLFRGIPEVARQKKAELHNRWNLEFDLDRLPGSRDLLDKEISRPAEDYYWTDQIQLRDTWERGLLLCVPVVGENKTVYGICGAEISALFFQLYAPVRQTEFGPVVTVLAPIENGRLMLDKGLTGGVTGSYPDRPEGLMVHQGKNFNSYTDGGAEYIGVQRPIRISLEEEECRQWVVAQLLPRHFYEAYRAESGRTLVLRCLAVLMALMAVSFLLYRRFLRPIGRDAAQLSRSSAPLAEDLNLLISFVRTQPPAQLFGSAGLPLEVDRALDRFLLRASALPEEERRIFRLLAEGCEPEGLVSRTGLSKKTVRKRLEALCSALGVADTEDILLYIDFFSRCGRREHLYRI